MSSSFIHYHINIETKITYIMLSFSSYVRKVLESYEDINNIITNTYTDIYDITRGVFNAKKYYLSDCLI